MNDEEHLAVEAAQYVQHVHDIADLLAERMVGLSSAQAEALLEQELARLQCERSNSKQLAARQSRAWGTSCPPSSACESKSC